MAGESALAKVFHVDLVAEDPMARGGGGVGVPGDIGEVIADEDAVVLGDAVEPLADDEAVVRAVEPAVGRGAMGGVVVGIVAAGFEAVAHDLVPITRSCVVTKDGIGG